jgi:hypothetical protein
MTPNAILEDVRRNPFRPFRIEVSDGSHYDIFHPEFCMVGTSYVIVGMSSDPNSPLFESSVKVDCRHIVKTYELPTNSLPGTNGHHT